MWLKLIEVAFVISGILLVILILLRKQESYGLSSAFGGVGGDTAFGVKTQKQLDKVITYASIFFILVAIMLSLPAIRPKSTSQPPAPVSAPEKNK